MADDSCGAIGWIERLHGGTRYLGDGAVELIAEPALTIDKADLLALLRCMHRGEAAEAPATHVAGIQDRCGCAIAKQAQADKHAGIIADIEGCRTDLHSHHCDAMRGMGSEIVTGRTKCGQRGTTARAGVVDEVGRRGEVRGFGDVAAEAGAEVAGAGADEERIDAGSIGLLQGIAQRSCCESGGFALEGFIQ